MFAPSIKFVKDIYDKEELSFATITNKDPVPYILKGSILNKCKEGSTHAVYKTEVGYEFYVTNKTYAAYIEKGLFIELNLKES